MGEAPGKNTSTPSPAIFLAGDRKKIWHYSAAGSTTWQNAKMTKQVFILAHNEARRRAMQAVNEAPEGYVVELKPRARSSAQNAKFHAICSDMGRAGAEWAGKARSAEEWKVLLVSGHAVATNGYADIIPGMEGEFINIRESTALMSKSRAASLITYALAYCADKGIPLCEWEYGE